MNGTLALTGSGEYLPRMEPVDRLLLSRLPDAPRVVCLPTAAGTEGPERIGYWSRLGVEHFTRLGAQAEAVKILDRADAEDDSFVEKVRAANFVYLSGGKPDYLYKTLAATKAWEAIAGVLESGGVVAGCSAGAMIFGEHIPSFPSILPLRPAFNFLPGAIIMPHFDEFGGGMASFVKMLVGRATLLGIEGFTALVGRDSTFTVAGSGGVTVWSREKKERRVDGESVTW